jgi:type II secretion system protein L
VKIVGLNIDKGRMAVSIVEKGFRRTELKDSFSQAFVTDAELVEILKEKAKAWAGARIVSSIPGRHFSQRTAHFPFADRKRVEKALPFELEDNIPFALEDVVLDHLVVDKAEKGPDAKGEAAAKKESAVLGMMLPKTVLRRHLDLLASAGVDPQVIVPSYLGLFNVAKMVPVEGAALLIDGSELCLKIDNYVTACRSFSDSPASGGIRHTIKAIETEHATRIEKVYLLSENDKVRGELVDLGIAVEQVTPDYNGKKAADPESLGLALCEELNFRKGDFTYHLADIATRKRRRTLIIAGAAAALFAIVNIGVKYYLIQSSYGKLDREIKEMYRQIFPDAKAVADPVRQLRSALDDAKKKFGVLGTGSSALDVMKAVTESG